MPTLSRPHPPAAAPADPPTFVALDFETADYGRDSACALDIYLISCKINQLSMRPVLIQQPNSTDIAIYTIIIWAALG